MTLVPAVTGWWQYPRGNTDPHPDVLRLAENEFALVNHLPNPELNPEPLNPTNLKPLNPKPYTAHGPSGMVSKISFAHE